MLSFNFRGSVDIASRLQELVDLPPHYTQMHVRRLCTLGCAHWYRPCHVAHAFVLHLADRSESGHMSRIQRPHPRICI